MAIAAFCSKAVIRLLLIHCLLLLELCGSWCCVLTLMWLNHTVFARDHLMHVRKCLLDVRCAIVMVNVFVVLLCRDKQQPSQRRRFGAGKMHLSPPPQ